MSYNKLFFAIFIFIADLFSQSAGSFSRIGFDSRTIAIGNSAVALINSPNSAYHNPATLAFTKNKESNLTFAFLSLDRNFKTLNYLQNIEPRGAFSLGLISSGVSNIDKRDSDGSELGNMDIYENQYYLTFANRFKDNFSAGITIKINHANLYDKLSSIIPGFDFGILYSFNDNLNFGLTIKDVGSKYKWDTSNLYGEYGNSSVNQFPQIMRAGFSYFVENYKILLLGEVFSFNKNYYFRFGNEFQLTDNFAVSFGVDKYSSNSLNPISPAFGATFLYPFNEYNFKISYAYVIESFNLFNAHWITLATSWK